MNTFFLEEFPTISGKGKGQNCSDRSNRTKNFGNWRIAQQSEFWKPDRIERRKLYTGSSFFQTWSKFEVIHFINSCIYSLVLKYFLSDLLFLLWHTVCFVKKNWKSTTNQIKLWSLRWKVQRCFQDISCDVAIAVCARKKILTVQCNHIGRIFGTIRTRYFRVFFFNNPLSILFCSVWKY